MCSALADDGVLLDVGTARGKNAYGYSYHFDIMAKSAVFGDNPVVSFKSVPCPVVAASDFAQCQCA